MTNGLVQHITVKEFTSIQFLREVTSVHCVLLNKAEETMPGILIHVDVMNNTIVIKTRVQTIFLPEFFKHNYQFFLVWVFLYTS